MEKKYETIIGMEAHIELKTASKMFCGCKNDPFHAPEPNIYTCNVCLGLPGALPIANKKAIEWTIKLGLALNCKINMYSKFDRKHYFYPDLPKGYQISQYDLPFCYEGYINTSFGRVRIRRIHLEEDTAKLVHAEIDGKKMTLVDFNRSSVPLIEVVTEPDIHSASQAKEYAQKLREIFRYLDIADCDMEQGGMRLEANISLKKSTATILPDYKVELKNINSFKFLEKGILFEEKRQAEILDTNGKIIQETRGYNEEKEETVSQRTKENAEDYRYFPDPDLPPIEFDEETLGKIKTSIPELPDMKTVRWEKEFGINPAIGNTLFEKISEADWYEELFILCRKEKIDTTKLLNSVVNKKLSILPFKDTAEKVIEEFKKHHAVEDIDSVELDSILSEVIQENVSIVAEYKSGKNQALNFLLGQVMKRLDKKVDVAKIRTELIKQLY